MIYKLLTIIDIILFVTKNKWHRNQRIERSKKRAQFLYEIHDDFYPVLAERFAKR